MSDDPNGQTPNSAEQGNGEVTFTPEQQAKIDEIINKRLGDVAKKHSEEIESLKTKHQNDLEESKKLAKMKEDEKAKYENDKNLQELEMLRKEKAERLHQDEINSLVSSAGLNPKISAKLFYHFEADEAKTQINDFKKVFEDAVLEEVNKRIKGHTPQGNNGDNTSDLAAMRKAMGLPTK